MIVFELNGQTSHMLPVLIGVLTSYIVSNSMTMSVFDVILEMKNLPFLPSLSSIDTYNKCAGDLMNKNFIFLKRKATLNDIPSILHKVGDAPTTIPVVDSEVKR